MYEKVRMCLYSLKVYHGVSVWFRLLSCGILDMEHWLASDRTGILLLLLRTRFRRKDTRCSDHGGHDYVTFTSGGAQVPSFTWTMFTRYVVLRR